MFDGFPLTGLIGIKLVSAADDICVQYEPVPDWVAVLRRPRRFGTKLFYRDVEEVLIPPQVISEIQGGDWRNPLFVVRRDEPGEWQWRRVEDEINRAARAVAVRFV